MKILIAYYSKTGNTERVAQDLAKNLGADVEKLIDKKKRGGILGWLSGGRDAMKKRLTKIAEPVKSAADYDLVILGTPVWGWDMVPAVRTYLEKEKDKFKTMALFVTSGNTSVDKVVKSFEDVINKGMVTMAGFNTSELKEESTYQKKLIDFIEAIKQQAYERTKID